MLKRLYKSKNVIGLIFFGGLILLAIPHLQSLSVETIVGYAPSSIPMAALAFLVIYVLKAIVMVIPLIVLYIAAGIIFPVEWAIIITYLGLAVALSIGYLFGKSLGEEKVNQVLAKHKKAAVFLDGHKDHLLSLCFLYRILPLPFDLFNMFCGALPMPFVKYLFVSLLGLSPSVIPAIIAVEHIEEPLSARFLVPFGVSLFVTLVSFAVYKAFSKK